MSLFKKLFGGGADKGARASGPTPIEHSGFLIYPEPKKTSGGYRISARIEKEIDGEVRSQSLIRADVLSSEEDAEKASVSKAMQLIDEQGDRLFR